MSHNLQKVYKANSKVFNKYLSGYGIFSYLQANQLVCYHFLDASSTVSSSSTISIFVWVPHSPKPQKEAMQRGQEDILCTQFMSASQPWDTGLGELTSFIVSLLFTQKEISPPPSRQLLARTAQRNESGKVVRALHSWHRKQEQAGTLWAVSDCISQLYYAQREKRPSLLPLEVNSKMYCLKFCP